jgi:hypothetical protein
MCELTSGYNGIICDVAGGVSAIYIGSLRDENTGAANYTFTRTTGNITAMANVSAKLFYTFNIDSEMSDFTVTSIGSRENASTGFEITGNIKFASNKEADVQFFENLVRDRVCIIAKLNDGSNEVLGLVNGLKVSLTRTSGTKFEDMNGYTLTISGREKQMTPKISDAIVTTLLS